MQVSRPFNLHGCVSSTVDVRPSSFVISFPSKNLCNKFQATLDVAPELCTKTVCCLHSYFMSWQFSLKIFQIRIVKIDYSTSRCLNILVYRLRKPFGISGNKILSASRKCGLSQAFKAIQTKMLWKLCCNCNNVSTTQTLSRDKHSFLSQ